MKATVSPYQYYDTDLMVNFVRPALCGSPLPARASVSLEVEWDEQAQELTHRYVIWDSSWSGTYYADSWGRAKEKALELIGCDGTE